MAEFGVARVTVRAGDATCWCGRVSVAAQRGRGTFVTGRPRQRGELRLATTLSALADMYRNDEPKLTLIDEASVAPRLRAADGMPAPRYRYLRRVHSRNGEAYCAIAIYLDERIFRKAPAALPSPHGDSGAARTPGRASLPARGRRCRSAWRTSRSRA